MPKNRWIYIGVLVVAAAALIWAATEVGNRIIFAMPYVAGVGVVLIVVGLVMESKKKQEAAANPAQTPPAG